MYKAKIYMVKELVGSLRWVAIVQRESEREKGKKPDRSKSRCSEA